VQSQASSLDQPGPGQGRSGPDWAREAFGERRTHLATPAVCSGAEARAVATAAFDQRARRFVRAEGQAQGNPALRVGCQLRLSGLSPQFDNTYRVLRTCHRYDLQQGYRTEFSAECAFLG
jgi:phage protein D